MSLKAKLIFTISISILLVFVCVLLFSDKNIENNEVLDINTLIVEEQEEIIISKEVDIEKGLDQEVPLVEKENEEQHNSNEVGEVEGRTDIIEGTYMEPLVLANEIHNEQLHNAIGDYHELINNITTYDNYKNIEWENAEVILKDLISELNEILSVEGSYPPHMKLDLTRLVALSEIASINHQTDPILYIHRILHDLDVEYNELEHHKYGFSNYDSGGQNQKIAADYIEQHKDIIKEK